MQKFARRCKSFLKSANYQLFWKIYNSGQETVNVETNVLYGGDISHPTPSQSFGSLIFNRLMKIERRNDVFQINAKTRDEMTVKECLEKSIALARRLQEEGVQKGDYILLAGSNSMNMNLSLLGTFFLGAIPLPLSNKSSLDEFRSIVKLLKPKYFGCDGKYLYYFKKALVESPDFDVSKIFVINRGDFPGEWDHLITFEEFIKGREEQFESFQPVQVNNPKDDLALLIKVSSKSMNQKLVGITHHNINSLIARFDNMENHRNFKEEIVLLVQNIIWMSGMYCLLLSCCQGSKLIIMDKFREETFLKAIVDFNVTTTFLYHSKCWQLLKYESLDEYDLSCCKNFYSVDGFQQNLFMVKLKEKYGVNLKNCYGFPEFCGSVLETTDDMNSGSTGKLVAQSYGKIISDKTSKNAGPNERGELCFKGPTLCKGYINDERSFKNSFDNKGFFLTGHYGYYDEKGEFYMIDRIVHQIQYKNYKISPKELEEIIRSLDSVKDVCVDGLQHETEGAYPIAFVSLQKGQNITEQEIIKHVNEKVKDFKRIRGVVFVPKIPRNKESGGIKRNLFKKALSRFRVKINPDDTKPDNVQSSDVEEKKAEEKSTS